MKSVTKLLVFLLVLAFSVLALVACDFFDINIGDNNNNNREYSVGLKFELNEDGKSYSVIGLGYCRDTDVVLPDTYFGLPVTSIGHIAFDGCTSLVSIEIPASVTSIGGYVFGGCTSLESIEVDTDNPLYKSVNGILYSKSGKELIHYAIGKKDTMFVIPSDVSLIGVGAFHGCTSLTSIGIPDSVTLIGDYAFQHCTILASIEIPDSVTSIGDGALYNCTSLASIEIPDSVTSIGDYAFQHCTSLASIEIPDSVTSIGNYAFRDCTSLESIEVDTDNPLYKSVNGILYSKSGKELIHYAIGKKDTMFVIPSDVSLIGVGAFDGCTSLVSIEIPDSVTSICHAAFSGCTSLASIEIPDSVTSIGHAAFSGCTSLVSIEIPDSVTSIGRFAFQSCTSLTSITFNNTRSKWVTITKGILWNDNTGKYTVYCTDGEISKADS